MQSNVGQRVEKGLIEKRENLYHWLESASTEEKQVCLCEDDACVEQHLDVIETSLKKAEDGTLGICKVCHGYVNDNLLEMDYTSSVCLDHFSPEDRRRLEAELELSQIIQRALLPQRTPTVQGLDLAVFTRPSDILGGDYFDFLQFKDGAFGVAIADVVGHGVSASIIMSSLQMALRTLVPQDDSPAKVLQQINHFYIHNINMTTFITAFLAHFESNTQTLTYSNAGQTPPLVIRKQGDQPVWLKPTSAAIGLVETYDPQHASVQLSKGDIVFFYTDGVTEANNPQGEQFGMQRLENLLAANADLSAQEIVSLVREEVNEFSAGQPLADDATMVALKVN
ncbi:MAG: PP2C family protein-serine/threonine phosphatase [Chloroflexi bacterium]|nr:PP2C family protein-serine/threonine phosphatase [Chloroflexota bacterium]